MSIAYRIRQNGITVARAEGSNAKLWMIVYAIRYCREKGEVTVENNAAGHWKRHMLIAVPAQIKEQS